MEIKKKPKKKNNKKIQIYIFFFENNALCRSKRVEDRT